MVDRLPAPVWLSLLLCPENNNLNELSFQCGGIWSVPVTCTLARNNWRAPWSSLRRREYGGWSSPSSPVLSWWWTGATRTWLSPGLWWRPSRRGCAWSWTVSWSPVGSPWKHCHWKSFEKFSMGIVHVGCSQTWQFVNPVRYNLLYREIQMWNPKLNQFSCWTGFIFKLWIHFMLNWMKHFFWIDIVSNGLKVEKG